MKKKPIYLLQMGGVLPVEAPIGPSENSNPLIQVASMPIDSGANVLVNLRQQRMQERLFNKELAFKEKMAGKDDERWKAQLALQKEQFAWQKESYLKDFDQRVSQWEREFDLGKKRLDMEVFFQKYTMFSSMLPSMTGPTGGNSKTKSTYGYPTGYHSPFQANLAGNTRKNAMSSVMDLMDSGGIDDWDPNTTLDKMRNLTPEIADYITVDGLINSQIMYHQQKINAYEENPEKFNQEYYEYQTNKIFSSNNLEDRIDPLIPSIHTAANDFFAKFEKIYGPGRIVADPSTGLKTLEQQTPDVRKDFVDWGKYAYSDALHKLYDMYVDKGSINPEIPYEDFADEYLNVFADASYRPDTKYTGTKWEDVEMDGQAQYRGGPYEGDSPSYTYGPAVNAPAFNFENDMLSVDIEGTSTVSYSNPIAVMARQSGQGDYGTDGEKTYSLKEDKKEDYIQITKDFLGADFDGSNFIVEETGEIIPFSDLVDDYGELTDKGVEVHQNFMKDYGGSFINAKLNLIEYQDAKDNGYYNSVVDRKLITEGILDDVSAGVVDILDLDTGEVFGGQRFLEKYAGSMEDREALEKTFRATHILDYTNLTPLMASKSGVQDPYRFGVFAHHVTALVNGKQKRFAITRNHEFTDIQNSQFKGGSELYNVAMAHKGIKADVPENAFYSTLDGMALGSPDMSSEELKKYLYNKLGPIKDSKGLYGSNVSIQWGGDESTSGTIYLQKPHLAGTAAILMEDITSELSKDDHVELHQISMNGRPAFYVDVNGEKSQVVPLMPGVEASNALRGVLKETADKASGGLVNMTSYFKNAIFPIADPRFDSFMKRSFVTKWAEQVDPLFGDIKYAITSANRKGDKSTAGSGRSFDITGRDPKVVGWFVSMVPGIEKTDNGVKYYAIPNSDFAVAWHRNMHVKYNQDGRVIGKEVIPLNEAGGGYHFDIKFKSDVNVVPVK